MFEKFYPTDDKGRGILLNEYKGTYSLIQAWKPETGSITMNWVFPKTKDGMPGNKMFPQKVEFGKLNNCIKILKSMLETLSREDDVPEF